MWYINFPFHYSDYNEPSKYPTEVYCIMCKSNQLKEYKELGIGIDRNEIDDLLISMHTDENEANELCDKFNELLDKSKSSFGIAKKIDDIIFSSKNKKFYIKKIIIRLPSYMKKDR